MQIKTALTHYSRWGGRHCHFPLQRRRWEFHN